MSAEKHAKITDTANKDSCNIFLVHLVKIKGGGGETRMFFDRNK